MFPSIDVSFNYSGMIYDAKMGTVVVVAVYQLSDNHPPTSTLHNTTANILLLRILLREINSRKQVYPMALNTSRVSKRIHTAIHLKRPPIGNQISLIIRTGRQIQLANPRTVGGHTSRHSAR